MIYLREPPPAAIAEDDLDGCPVCEVVEQAGQALALRQDTGVTAVVHPAGRLPYEVLIAGAHPELDLVAALRLLRGCVAALRSLEGPVAWNAWLHNAWQGRRRPHVHPHIELVPRLTVMGGLEIGAGIYVNTLAPEVAAARLRSA